MFLTWYQLGGMEHPPSLAEVAAMPADLRHDVLLLVQELGKARRTARKRKQGREPARRSKQP